MILHYITYYPPAQVKSGLRIESHHLGESAAVRPGG